MSQPASQSPEPAPNKRGFSPLFFIFLTVLIDMIGFGIVIPILPLYSERLHAEPWQIGLLLGVFSAMQLIFAPILGRWSDKIGRRPILLFSILGTAAAFLMMGLAKSLAFLFIGRMLDGISGANIPTAQAYIADVTPVEKRSRAMGMIGAAFGLGFVFGPAIGGLLSHYFTLETPFFFAAGLATLNAIGLFFFLPESLPPEKRGLHADRPSIWQSLRSAWNTPLRTVMLCSLLSTMAFSAVTALYVLFTEKQFSWHAHENGLMFAYIGFIGAMIQGGMLGRLLKRGGGEKPLIIIGSACLVLSMVMLPLSHVIPMLIVSSTLLSLGNSLVTPLLSGWASKSADPKSQGVILGLMQSIASLARMIGPSLGGILLTYDFHHPEHIYGISPFWGAAVVMAIGLVLAFRLQASDHGVHLQPASS